MRLVSLSMFCCGCTLRCGCIFIGIILLIASGISMFFEGLMFLMMYPNMPKTPKGIFSVHVGHECVCVILHLALIVGALCRTECLVRFWVWVTVISLHIRSAIVAAGNIATYPNGDPVFDPYITLHQLVSITFHIYSLVVANSYHTVLVHPEEEEEPVY